MQLLVAAVGQRMPNWVSEAWTEYSRRMPPSLVLSLREISLAKRSKKRRYETIDRDRKPGNVRGYAEPREGHCTGCSGSGMVNRETGTSP